MSPINYDQAVEISDNVYWVGYNQTNLLFHTNSYLIIDKDEAVLIDPGSALDFDVIVKKIEGVCPLKNIRHIVLHHQDPDLCGSATEFEKLSDVTVYIPERSAVFTKYYGIKSFVNLVRDCDTLELKSGRVLRFLMTPYCHSPGAMVTYDEKSKILFSSDIFGAFNQGWRLFADEIDYKEHLASVKRFMEPYMASKEAVMNFVKKAEKLPLSMICPQHGSILRKTPKKWLGELKKMKFGTALTEKKSGLELGIFGRKAR
jgi:two-component system, cell cycle response regulator